MRIDFKLATVLLIMSTINFSAMPARASATSTASNEQAIRSQAADYARLFQAGNAKALAEMWTDDGDWIDENGTVISGRANIEKELSDYFKKRGGQPMKIAIDSLRFPLDNMAIEEGTCTLLNQSVPVSASRYSVVHVKKDGKWKMYSVTETTCPQPTDSIKDLNWLIGLWQADGAKGVVHLSGTWDANHNFITFADTGSTGQPLSIIGWDPIIKKIIVWHYNSDGGYGRGILLRQDDNTWVERSRGVEPDGQISRAEYVIRRFSDDKFTWQSTHRHVGGNELPDCEALTVAREYSTK